ncbi:MAG: PucR family transcriptional regulator [Thermomicrobiales bacterium]
MPLTVAEVLDLEILRAGRVVAGARDLAQRRVRSVAVIEVPVDDFVREGDLVLTTAMGVGHDAALFAVFVRDVARSNAAALLVALGPHAEAIPGEVSAAAESLALPLVTLPWELTFSDISNAVLGRLLDEQHAVVRESLALQERLTQLVIDGADLAGLARALAAMLGRPVAIADAAGNVLARGGGTSEFETQVQEAVRRQANPSAEGLPEADSLRLLPANGLALAAIESGRETCGYIATPIGAGPLTAVERLTLQHAVTAAALCMLQRRAAEETALRLRDDFVWSLAASYIASPADAIARGRLLGDDVSLRYAGLYGKVERGESDDEHRGLPAQSRLRILDAIEGAAAHQRRAALATVIGDVVVAFVEVSRASESLEGLVDRINTRLQSHSPAIDVSWGIGAVHEGFANFRLTYRDARAACQIGASVRGAGSVTHVSQTGSYRVLLGIGANPESRRFWDGYLRDLIDYGEQKGMDLLGTLELYLTTQGNVSETARRLHLHRQSLLYRLQRIEELTGGDLSDAQHRFALELSTHLYRLRDIAPPDPDWSHPRPRRVKVGSLKPRSR